MKHGNKRSSTHTNSHAEQKSMSGKTCLRLVERLGLSVTMTGNFVKFCFKLIYTHA